MDLGKNYRNLQRVEEDLLLGYVIRKSFDRVMSRRGGGSKVKISFYLWNFYGIIF